jgi:predicted transglutaminase-like cysteine proteinase
MLNADGQLILTPAIWEMVQDAQKEGNKVVWTDDRETWGEIERWDFPKEVGRRKIEDCDGITLYKMRDLIKRGIPAKCLLFTIVYTEEDEGHAILCVKTDRGDFLLDNRHVKVKSYDDLKELGYRFMYRTKDGKMAQNWVKISKS